jgi:hypothetical protein
MTDRPMTASRDMLAEIFSALRAADDTGPISDKGLDVLGGLSGRKTIGALQRLVSLFQTDPSACYVEVGVYRGLTLLTTALHAPAMPCFGIDNFSLLDPEGINLNIVRSRMAQLDARNAQLINEGFEEAFSHIDDYLCGRRIAVYFVDGAHDYRSQLMGLILALPFLHEHAVILVDDANFQFVRQSTRDFLIGFPEFKLIFDAYSPAHPANLAEAERKHWEDGWLNGINILVRDPQNRLPAMHPETRLNTDLYVNEWLIHRLQMAELAPDALRMAQAMCLGNAVEEAREKEALQRRFANMQAKLATRFPDRNTFSDGLPEGRFNRLA